MFSTHFLTFLNPHIIREKPVGQANIPNKVDHQKNLGKFRLTLSIWNAWRSLICSPVVLAHGNKMEWLVWSITHRLVWIQYRPNGVSIRIMWCFQSIVSLRLESYLPSCWMKFMHDQGVKSFPFSFDVLTVASEKLLVFFGRVWLPSHKPWIFGVIALSVLP